MLPQRSKQAFSRLLEPLAGWLAGLGVSPAAVTLAGPVLVSLLCLWFLRTHAVIPFVLGIGAIELLDVLDGAIARTSGQVTKFGSYLDAICDRYFESIVVLTTAVVTGYWTLSMVVLAGTLLVSYAKARAAMEISVSNAEWPDLMERLERSALFGGGLLLSALCPWQPLGHDLFWWTLVILAVLIHLTVIQRVLRARQFLRTR